MMPRLKPLGVGLAVGLGIVLALLNILEEGRLAVQAGAVLKLLVWLGVSGAAFYLFYFLLSLPFRRAERARLFLSLVEEGVRAGSVERFLVRVSRAKESSLGVRFHLLAAWLEQGVSLDEALTKVPRLLPPQITALLRMGRETGQLPAVLPACRERLRDASSAVHAAQGRMLVILFGILPLQFLLFTLIRVVVWPKFQMIGEDMGADMSAMAFAIDQLAWLWPVVFLAFGLPILVGAVSHMAGPRVWLWTPLLLPGLGDWLVRKCGWVQRVPDWVALQLPWRRHRLQRDFVRVLAQLLDLRFAEERAVRLAGESTANHYIQQRALRVAEALQRGTKLPDALALIADGGELRWRLDTAAHAQGIAFAGAAGQPLSAPTGFQAALAGWLAALDAKAFQEEQAAAHLLSTAFVLANGLLVALLCTGTMQMLVSLIAVAGEW